MSVLCQNRHKGDPAPAKQSQIQKRFEKNKKELSLKAVSYTHLDVYKRQI